MMTRPEKLTPGNIKCWMIAFLALLFTLTSVIPARAQTATPPTPRDVLIQTITQQGQSDEKQGTKESAEG